jgi:hypothetical protein
MSSRVLASRRLAISLLGRATRQARRGCADLLASLALVAAVAGCAGQAAAGLPPKSGAPASAAELTAPQPAAREQVLAAYTGYWQASSAAVNAGSAASARTLLARYLTAGAIPVAIAALRPDWADHAVSAGSPVLHILSIKITGRHALVHDCTDLSHAGLANARTGRVYPRSFGSAHANFYADLLRSSSGWLISNLVPVMAPCEP